MNILRKLTALLSPSTAPVPPSPLTATSGRERRGAPRVAVGCPAALLQHDRRLSVKLQDLSLTGLQLVTRFETDHQFLVELEVGTRRLTLTASVVRADFEHGLYRMGARFVDMNEAQAALLAEFIDMHTRHQGRTVA